MLCALMFGLVIYAAKMELRSAQRLGLLNTYTTIFALNPDDLEGTDANKSAMC